MDTTVEFEKEVDDMTIFEFLEKGKTAYQVIDVIKKQLDAAGFQELSEKDSWELYASRKAYVIRNDSSIIAFAVPSNYDAGFQMICAHSDSPCLKLKENMDVEVAGHYHKLNSEIYGGMIKETWFDRPLSVAGRIVCDVNGKLVTKLVDFEKPIGIIPSLAIHMSRGEDKDKINPQLHMQALVSTGKSIDKDEINDNKEFSLFKTALAKKYDIDAENILGMDLYLYPTQKPEIVGLNDDMIVSPRLDDLECSYCALESFLEYAAKMDPKTNGKIAVMAIFDNEEVGSQTMQGAGSNFLETVLERVVNGLPNMESTEISQVLANSFLLSADNAHGLHPNYTDKADSTNRPLLNEGVVIKYHGGQKYTTSAYSGATVKMLCKRNNIPYQVYHNRSDIAGGSTLGNIALSKVSVPAADIGLAQLAMHSAVETAGIKDIDAMTRLMEAFYRGA